MSSDPPAPPAPPAPPPHRRSTHGTSAFSRLAGVLPLPSALSTTSSNSPASSLLAASSITSSSSASTSASMAPPLAATMTTTPPPPTTSTPGATSAVNALEALAHADTRRMRYPSRDSPIGSLSSTSQPSASGSSAPAPPPATATSHAARSSSDASRSRERQARVAAAVPAAAAGESSWSTHSNAYWGMEALPSNANASSFSSSSYYPVDVNASHFFGASAFSFEDSSAASVGSFRYYQPSSQISTSLFAGGGRVGGGGSTSYSQSGPNRSAPPAAIALREANVTDPSSRSSSAGSSGFNNSPSQNPSSWGVNEGAFGSRRRGGESAMGGGRKLKESSRGLRFGLGTVVTRERGMVGMARPKELGDARVAVAGKTCLRILKVPSGIPRRTHEAPPSSISSRSSSSIAYRRSRSRGAAADTAAASSDDGPPFERKIDKDEVAEVLDVKLGARLGAVHLFSDVAWGYAATSNKIATSSTNGTVVLWDLAKDGSNRVDQIRHEHDRRVNRVLFGGATGSWIASGGQDGLIKLWDVREAPNQTRKLKAASPVRHMAFSPSPSQPWTLLAACASGTLIRYDVRYVNAKTGGVTDRIAGHTDACLSMDWRDSFAGERSDTAGGNREGGWVVTGGMDRTIKIWDFSGATIATKPFRTLYPSQPAATVAWHPTRPTELATSPLPQLLDDGASDDPDGATLRDGLGAAWKNEIEVWDVRRPYFPKYAIKTDEAASALLYNDEDTLWSVSRSSATFVQHDVNSDSYALLDSIPRASPAWHVDGTLAYAEHSRTHNDVPFELRSAQITDHVDQKGLDAPVFRPDAIVNTLQQFDPEFPYNQFAFLANNLIVGGASFGDMCEANAETYAYAERPDASQLLLTLQIWLDDDAALFPDSPPLTPPGNDSVVLPESPSRDPGWTLPPSLAAAPVGTSPHRFRYSHSSAYANAMRRTSTSSPHVGPTEPSKIPLPDFVEESTSSETDSSAPGDRATTSGYAYYPDLSSTSSDSELDTNVKTNATRKFSSSSSGSAIRQGLNGLTSLKPMSSNPNGTSGTVGRRSRSSTSAGVPLSGTVTPVLPEGHDPIDTSRASSASRTRTHRPSTSSSDSESGADAEEGPGRRHRFTAIQAVKARRASSSTSDRRRPTHLREALTVAQQSAAPSRGGSADATVVFDGSRRGSLIPSVSLPRGSTDIKAAIAAREHVEKLVFKAQREQAMKRRVDEATELVRRQIKATLQEYADQGDSQLCATICCMLQDRGIDLDSLFVARVTQSYLDSLRAADLHVAAAALNKHTSVAKLREKTQTSVTFYTACGTCGKALEGPRFGTCARCSARATRCCVCHRVANAIFIFCVACGHGAHPECLASFAAAITTGGGSLASPSISAGGLEAVAVAAAAARGSSVMSGGTTSPHHSHPSTPGFIGPVKAWMWGDADLHDHDTDEETGELISDRQKEREALLGACPSGLCAHSPCLLAI